MTGLKNKQLNSEVNGYMNCGENSEVNNGMTEPN